MLFDKFRVESIKRIINYCNFKQQCNKHKKITETNARKMALTFV